jgi:hypothetical protein
MATSFVGRRVPAATLRVRREPLRLPLLLLLPWWLLKLVVRLLLVVAGSPARPMAARETLAGRLRLTPRTGLASATSSRLGQGARPTDRHATCAPDVPLSVHHEPSPALGSCAEPSDKSQGPYSTVEHWTRS